MQSIGNVCNIAFPIWTQFYETMGLGIKILISERNDPDRQSLKIYWVILRYIFDHIVFLIIVLHIFLDDYSGNGLGFE